MYAYLPKRIHGLGHYWDLSSLYLADLCLITRQGGIAVSQEGGYARARQMEQMTG
jgi:hypothetical protein